MSRTITIDVVLPHPPAEVWRALTDPTALADWLMPVEVFAPVVGQKFVLRAKPMPGWDGVVNCEVTEVDEPHRLAYTWHGSNMRHPTTVTWQLSEADNGTRLQLEHSGFSGILLAFLHRNGWRRIVHKRLATHLTRAEAHED
jgi:uncharacterized protein YndB with AHSA1/START domain